MRRYEHQLDRLTRIGIAFKITAETEDGYWYRSGKSTYSWLVKNPVTMLKKCDCCGLVSTPKRIQERSDVYRWNAPDKDYSTKSKHLLCMACWNKVRALLRTEELFKQAGKLLAAETTALRKRKAEANKQAAGVN